MTFFNLAFGGLQILRNLNCKVRLHSVLIENQMHSQIAAILITRMRGAVNCIANIAIEFNFDKWYITL